MPERPPFIIRGADVDERRHQYPNSDEKMSPSRPIGARAGLLRIGVHLVRVMPGTRTSWPHAEEDEEEFVYVVDGEVDAWIDGELHHMVAGDFAAFPAGTGISHVFLNNGDRDALLLSGGEAAKSDSRIFYPLNPGRKKDMAWSNWWDDVPARKLGPHDGLPDALRPPKVAGGG
jgi:uncharacterized cupin superfamily protein